jgi:predicted permease
VDIAESFHLLFEKLSPLFLLLLTGFVAAKWLNVTRESLAKLVIYVISPIVFFDILIKSPFSAKLFALPFVYAALCSVLGLLTYHFSKKIFRSPQRNLLSYAAGSANTGYFGIPATAILLGEDKLNTAIFIIIGYNLYEYTTGFYLAARGSFDRREAFKKVITLPSIWTFFLAMFVSFMGVNSLPENLHPIMLGFRGSYTTLGIMMVGLGLGTIQNKKLNFKFISVALFCKIIIFPLFAMALIYLDKVTLGVLDYELREILLLMSLVPMAANGVAIASELKLPTDDIAISITLSTLLALVWIPFCWATWVPWFLNMLNL